VWSGQTGDAIAYSVVGQNVVLFPKPSTGTYIHIYVPQAPDISSLADTSTIDVVTNDGEAFLIWGVAVKALGKRKQDPSLAMAERDAAEKRFYEDAQLRAFANPRRRVIVPGPTGTGMGWPDEDGWLARDPGGWWNR
jgi:hypothetical protein